MLLYGKGQSRSYRVLWALEECGLEYDYVEIKFGENSENGSLSEGYRKLNPQGKIPTLIDDDLVITETGAILNYLATKTPEKNLMPQDGTAQRTQYDQMCYFVLTELEQPLWTDGKHRFALPEQYRVSDVIAKTTHYEFDKAQSALMQLKGDHEYAAGDHFTMADILLAHTLGWAKQFGYEVNDELTDYRRKMFKRAGFLQAAEKIK